MNVGFLRATRALLEINIHLTTILTTPYVVKECRMRDEEDIDAQLAKHPREVQYKPPFPMSWAGFMLSYVVVVQ